MLTHQKVFLILSVSFQNHYQHIIHHPDRRHMINSSDEDKEHDPGQTEDKHQMYDRLDETKAKDFLVADGFVSFMWKF